MIRVLNPWILNHFYIALIPAILLFIYTYTRRKQLLKLVRVRDNIYWYLVQAAKIGSILMVFIALSMPVQVSIVEKYVAASIKNPEVLSVIHKMTALHVLIIDESKSMLYTDGTNTTRFSHALRFVTKYLSYISRYDKVMIIGFAEYPRKICIGTPTTCNESLIKLRPGKRFSNLASALTYAYTYANAAQYPAVFILVTDGAYNKGGDPYDAMMVINKSGYPILFARVGLDYRANRLVLKLRESGIRVISVNELTKNLIDELARGAARELRIEAFIAKKILEIKVVYEELNPYPTLVLLIGGLSLFMISRIEGY